MILRSLIFLILFPSFLLADVNSDIARLGFSSAKTIGLTVYDQTSDKIVFERNAKTALKPASILKLLVTTYALKNFGADYRFETKLYGSFSGPGHLSKLVIKGDGDPNFRSEDLWMLARRLTEHNITKVDQLIIDNSSFPDASPATGQRAYQAGSSALAFNYNALRLTACPNTSRGNAHISWEPKEFPVSISGRVVSGSKTSFGAQKNSDNSFAVSGSVGRSCVNVYRSLNNPERMIGYALENYLNYLGIKFAGQITYGKGSASTLLATHESKPLYEILANLNKFSSNFIAEQILHLVGNNSRRQGLNNLSSYLRSLGADSSEFSLSDASGLSHSNRISSAALMKVFRAAVRDPKIYAEFLASLAVNGTTGTLKRRKLNSGIVLRGKTGTINGVDALAGQVIAKSGKTYLFVLMQNGLIKAGTSEAYENRLINLLYNS